MRTLAILVHAGAGVVAFLLGVELLAEARAHEQPTRFKAYLGLMATMAGSLVIALEIDWLELEPGARIGFAALFVLAVVMVWRADQAGKLLPDLDGRSRMRFIDHVGFTLISLFDGFVIVAVLESSAPEWLAVVAGVGGVVIGHRALQSTKRAAAAGPDG